MGGNTFSAVSSSIFNCNGSGSWRLGNSNANDFNDDVNYFNHRKEDLVKTKTDLFNNKSNYGKRPNWVKPLKDWVKTAHNVGKLVDSSADLFEIKCM